VPSIRTGFAAAEHALGPIDIVVNNSGVAVTRRATDVEEADYDEVMDTNLRGAFFVAQAAGRGMIAAKRPGRIINIASAGGLRPLAQIAVYCMSKAAVIHMTRALALEWGRHGINVNALCPGYIETDLNREAMQGPLKPFLDARVPLGRPGKTDEVARLVASLFTEDIAYLTGETLYLDGGQGMAH